VARRVQHLRQHGAPPTTPLYTVFQQNGRTKRIRAKDITARLRCSCVAIGNSLGLTARDISARALRAGGAMALLRARVDSCIIRLLGRWKSWAMLEYLHRSATNTTPYAQMMMAGGRYTIDRHATLPADIPLSLPSDPLDSEL
jgi:hypothetical protein